MVSFKVQLDLHGGCFTITRWPCNIIKNSPTHHFFFNSYLFPCSCFSSPQFNISCDQFIPSIHFSLIRQNNLPPSTRRIYSKSFLETLFNFWSPNPLSILSSRLFIIVEFTGIKFCYLWADCLGNSGQSDGIISLKLFF